MNLIQGDNVETLKSIEEQSVDLIFADPPYNLQLSQEHLYRPDQSLFGGTRDAWDSFPDLAAYTDFSEEWLKECQRVLKPTGSIWVIGSYHNIFTVGSLMQKMGFWFLNDIVWIKSNPAPNFRGTRFCNAHETLIWAARSKKSRPYFNYHAMKNLNGEKQMRSDWVLPICSGNERLKKDGKKAHSTQKPESLLYRVILSSSKVGDLILDPFLGSGTTGAVAKKLRRNFIGIDISPDYVSMAQKRIEAIEPLAEEPLLVEPKQELKVPFSKLLELSLINPGCTLYFNEDRDAQAVVLADGSIQYCNGLRGSIHQAGKYLSNGAPCNGWEHWYYEEGGSLHPIQEKRILARTLLKGQQK